MASIILLTVLTAVVLVLTWAIQQILEWRRRHLILLKLPHRPADHWLLGNTDGISNPKKLHRSIVDTGKELGKIAYKRILHIQAILLYDPVLIAKVFDRDLGLSKSHMGAYKFVTKVTSPHGQRNLVSMDTDDMYWKLIRKAVAPAFAHKHMRRAFDVVMRYSHQLVCLMGDAGGERYLDVDNLLLKEAVDVIGEWGFGQDLGTIKGDHKLGCDVLSILSAIAREVMLLFAIPLRKYMFWDKSLREAQKSFQAFYKFEKRLMGIAKSKGPPSASCPLLVSHLLRITHPHTGQPLPDSMLEAQVGVFFFAGHDTSGHTMAYTLYLLSQHPEVESQVAAELDELGLLVTAERPHPRPLEFDDLSRLKYLQFVVKESQRVLPVVPMVARASTKDLDLGGYIIPKNMEIAVSLIGVHLMHWEDGAAFRPERWMEPDAHIYSPPSHPHPTPAGQPCVDGKSPPQQTLHATAGAAPVPPPDKQIKRFLPFAEGPRDCVGQSLAKITVPTTLAVLLSHFKFELDPNFDHESLDVNGVTMSPENGIPMRCIPRAAVVAG